MRYDGGQADRKDAQTVKMRPVLDARMDHAAHRASPTEIRPTLYNLSLAPGPV
jgi:hypothetical protein